MYVCGYPTVPVIVCRPETYFWENLQKIIEDIFKNFYVSVSVT